MKSRKKFPRFEGSNLHKVQIYLQYFFLKFQFQSIFDWLVNLKFQNHTEESTFSFLRKVEMSVFWSGIWENQEMKIPKQTNRKPVQISTKSILMCKKVFCQNFNSVSDFLIGRWIWSFKIAMRNQFSFFNIGWKRGDSTPLRKISRLIVNPHQRVRKSQGAFETVPDFSWLSDVELQ